MDKVKEHTVKFPAPMFDWAVAFAERQLVPTTAAQVIRRAAELGYEILEERGEAAKPRRTTIKRKGSRR